MTRPLVYLDHHATTPCSSSVVDAMLPFFSTSFGNAASRSHRLGYAAKEAVEQARRQVAHAIGARPKELVFTSGATESNNLALLGSAAVMEPGHLLTVATEHKAVLDPLRTLRDRGWALTELVPAPDGRVSVAQVEQALRADTRLVSVMAVNNEIGTLQPIADIGALCRERGIRFHCDAAQAPCAIDLDVKRLSVDLLSLSAHKAYGPKGVGALFVRRTRPKLELQPLQFGGGHERGLRSGTLAVPLIVGMGAAFATLGGDKERARVAGLRDALLAGLQAAIPGVRVNGSLQHRAAGNLNLFVEGVDAEDLMLAMPDVAISSGSACTSADLAPSHVLLALGLSSTEAHRSVRFGLGRASTRDEIDYVVQTMSAAVRKLRG